MSQLPASAVRTLRPQAVKTPTQRAAAVLGSAALSSSVPSAAAPGPVAVPPPAPAPPPPNNTVDLDVIGPRKLIRPTQPGSALRNRRFQRQDEPALLMRSSAAHVSAPHESSHAEAFYLQKQVQAQTPMVFVLDDGEKVEGCIEWYDRNVIKVRSTSSSPFRVNNRSESGTRMLIYKSSIKYLYKAGENQPQF
jgi:sRNA-binding regulator protein Hfq